MFNTRLPQLLEQQENFEKEACFGLSGRKVEYGITLHFTFSDVRNFVSKSLEEITRVAE